MFSVSIETNGENACDETQSEGCCPLERPRQSDSFCLRSFPVQIPNHNRLRTCLKPGVAVSAHCRHVLVAGVLVVSATSAVEEIEEWVGFARVLHGSHSGISKAGQISRPVRSKSRELILCEDVGVRGDRPRVSLGLDLTLGIAGDHNCTMLR